MEAQSSAERRFHALIERSEDAVTLLDRDGRRIYASPASQRILGWHVDDETDAGVLERVHPEDVRRGRELFGLLRSQPGGVVSAELRMRHRDGTYRWIRAVGTNLLHDPDVGGIVVNHHDVTALKEAEERAAVALHAEKAAREDAERVLFDLGERVKELRLLHDAAQLLQDDERPLEDLLRALAERIPAAWQHPEHTAARVRCGALVCDSAPRPGSLAGVAWAAQADRRMRVGFSAAGGDGEIEVASTGPLDASGQAFLPEEHDALRSLAEMLRWHVDRRRASESLRDSNRRLEQALEEGRRAHEQLRAAQEQVVEQERLRALGQMAAGVAHDLNNALAPVLGFTDVLRSDAAARGDCRRLLSYLDLIHAAAADAAGVVRRLREFYRPRDEGDAFGPVDAEALVRQVVALTRPKWRDEAQAAGVQVKVELDIKPAPPIHGGEAQLREALVNLVFNAVDALPNGGTVTLTVEPDGVGEVGGAGVCLAVRDTGMGMSEEARRRCLEPFFTTKGERGTGLGLPMVHGVVHRHEGRLEIESAPRRGTVVRLHLPGAAPGARVAGPETPGQVAGAGVLALGGGAGLRILVVDDEPALREVVVTMLAALGHQASVASGGAEGLALFDPDAFDLVITDRSMPGVPGDRLAAEVKRRSPHTPVVMLTGFGDLLDPQGGGPQHIDALLSKPATLARLQEAIAKVCASGHAVTA